MSTTPAEQDAEWAEWFNALGYRQADVRKALAGESTELDLEKYEWFYNSWSTFTHIPRRLFTDCPALTILNLNGCSSLAALPDSIGQLQALTKLNLYKCSSLAAESRERSELVTRRNEQIIARIRNNRALRFPMTTHDFAATVLFGSMLPRPPSAGDRSGDASNDESPAAAAAAVVVPDAQLPRVVGAYPDCMLSKLNGDGIHFASLFKRRIADFCGVSYDRAAVAEWMEVEIKVAVEEELNWPFGHQHQPAPQCWWGAYRSAT